jgi:hypothetical protein
VDARPVTNLVLLVVVAGAALHVWRRIVLYWWQVMAGHVLTPVFRPSETRGARIKHALLAVLVLGLAVLPAVLATVWTLYPGAVTWSTLDRFLAAFATFVLVVLYIATVGALVWVTRTLFRDWIAAYAHTPRPLLALKGLWPLPLMWAFYGGGGGALLATNPLTTSVLPYAASLVVAVAVAWALYTAGARYRWIHRVARRLC